MTSVVQPAEEAHPGAPGDADLAQRAAELRAGFDHAFALPPAEASEERTDLLRIRAGAAYAVRVSELAGVVAHHAVTWVPSAAPHLLGVCNVRGVIVPVFCLASLLGHDAPAAAPGWLLLCRAEELIGLAFSELDGYLREPGSAMHASPPAAALAAAEVVRTAGGALPLIAIPALLARLRARPSQPPAAEEH